jgi:hypothetical protein
MTKDAVRAVVAALLIAVQIRKMGQLLNEPEASAATPHDAETDE